MSSGFWVLPTLEKKSSCDFEAVANYLCSKGRSSIKENFLLSIEEKKIIVYDSFKVKVIENKIITLKYTFVQTPLTPHPQWGHISNLLFTRIRQKLSINLDGLGAVMQLWEMACLLIPLS